MRKRSLGMKLTLLLSIAMLLMGAMICVFSYVQSWNAFLTIYSGKAQQFTRTIAPLLDGDKLKKYIETGATDAYYEEARQMLTGMKTAYNMMYLYVFIPHEDSLTYVMEAQRPEDDPALITKLGDVYEYRPGGMEYTYLLEDVQTKSPSEEIISGVDPVLGASVTAWAPILDSDGNVAAMLEADFSMLEVQHRLRSYILAILVMIAAAVCLFDAALVFFMRRLVARPVAKLSDAVSAYASDQELNAIDVRIETHNELQTLAEAFSKMGGDINRYIENLTRVTREKERIGAELSVATQIQANMLPRIFPPFPQRHEFGLYAMMNPAKEVGGDFFDFFMTDDDHLVLVIADVSGKGVPAALFMVIAKTLIKNCAQTGASPKTVLETVNNQLCENNEAGMFVTVWMGNLEISSGHMVCANAGHEFPAIMRAGGAFELVKDKHGFVLAGMENVRYCEYDLELNPGDRLYVYTDGVPEATNGGNELFGTERMLASMNRHKNDSIDRILHAIREDVDAFVDGAPQFDDVTMLLLQMNERMVQ